MSHLEPGVEGVLHTLSGDCCGQHHQGDRKTRRQHHPPRSRHDRTLVQCILDHPAPRHHGGIPESQEADVGLGEDRVGHHQHRVGEQQWRHLRHHMAGQNEERGGSHRLHPFDESALPHRHHLSPDEPCRRSPVDQSDDDHDVGQALTEHRRRHDHQRNIGDHQEVVGDSHQHAVGTATEIARDETDSPPDQHADQCRDQSHQK